MDLYVLTRERLKFREFNYSEIKSPCLSCASAVNDVKLIPVHIFKYVFEHMPGYI